MTKLPLLDSGCGAAQVLPDSSACSPEASNTFVFRPQSRGLGRRVWPEPDPMKSIVSDREFIIAVSVLALFILFGAAVIVAFLVGFWLTATNRWAADSAFLFGMALIFLGCIGVGLLACARTFFTPVDGASASQD